MVGLDLSDIDEVVINYAKFITDYWKIEEIIFLHNIKKTDLHDLWDGFLDEKEISLEKLISKEISEKVNLFFDNGVKFSVEVSAEAFKKAELLNEIHPWQQKALHVYNIPSVYFPYIDREKAID